MCVLLYRVVSEYSRRENAETKLLSCRNVAHIYIYGRYKNAYKHIKETYIKETCIHDNKFVSGLSKNAEIKLLLYVHVSFKYVSFKYVSFTGLFSNVHTNTQTKLLSYIHVFDVYVYLSMSLLYTALLCMFLFQVCLRGFRHIQKQSCCRKCMFYIYMSLL